MSDTNLNAIRHLNADDRPREKMLTKGKEALSDVELIAVLIGSGTKTKNAIQVAQEILHSVNYKLNHLAHLSIKELMQFEGIGEVKALKIATSLEIGRRKRLEDALVKPQIKSSQDAYNILEPLIADLTIEEFHVLFLSQSNKVIYQKRISSGGITGTVVDKRIVLKEAILNNATGLILAHNHPSGNLHPSQADITLTKDIKTACTTLDIRLLDHIIITQNGYYSFLDEGML